MAEGRGLRSGRRLQHPHNQVEVHVTHKGEYIYCYASVDGVARLNVCLSPHHTPHLAAPAAAPQRRQPAAAASRLALGPPLNVRMRAPRSPPCIHPTLCTPLLGLRDVRIPHLVTDACCARFRRHLAACRALGDPLGPIGALHRRGSQGYDHSGHSAVRPLSASE